MKLSVFVIAAILLAVPACSKSGDVNANAGGPADDVKAAGLPLYPAVDPGKTAITKGADQNGTSIAVSTMTNDPFAKVDAWYASRLGSQFQANRINLGAMHETTFKSGDERNGRTVIVTAVEDPKTHRRAVSIMLLAKTKA